MGSSFYEKNRIKNRTNKATDSALPVNNEYLLQLHLRRLAHRQEVHDVDGALGCSL